ncbi:type VI secretion system-associated FHA domain protein TagH [Pseudomonas corrugata]|uniref:type VI secretion system-associated FHA domain protein TagH n=1 Tax=Pseudomonas corrugata TaxID=47879 RepID=UPI001585E1D9|nr:type VI secretion system-associated FHA domain protein TagH [Pseudomonas corrugata]MCI0993434.1 type VI secretion system-associated FHA domain protein TagH [Pseudomonas corrugata]NUT65315.1 type VI secretion system-associated FHA domain protein TagH [Pseudomonas corrugata]
MELVLEMLNARQFIPAPLCRKTFGSAGGVIGRGESCDWVIPDRQRLLSKRHAQISSRDGEFFLTDTSGNGVSHRTSGERLTKGEPVRIQDGDVFLMGDFEILARLAYGLSNNTAPADRPLSIDSLIPDDAFLDLDPLKVLGQQPGMFSEIDELISPSVAPADTLECPDYATIDMENLRLPELVEASAAPKREPVSPATASHHPGENFWERFGTALGMDLGSLDNEARETLALNAARLLRQSIQGLQQNLHTRSELKSELRLARTLIQGEQKNPLKFADDAQHALQMLLQPNKPAQLPAEQAIARAFRDLRAHQVALLTASRATLRATLEHFSPQRLMFRLEREHKPLIRTSGRYWRAYGRYHQALCEDDDWTGRLLARDFVQAYEEQVRLVSTLHTDHHG